jgi:hypothetical protein
MTGDGLCSLPEAVAYADGTSEPDCGPGPVSGTTTIIVPASATTYTVPATLAITKNTTIMGGGATSTVIDGGGMVTVLSVASGAVVTLEGATISGGLSGSTSTCTGAGVTLSCTDGDGLDGGGIDNAGTLTIRDSIVTHNQASPGTAGILPPPICLMAINCPGHGGGSAGHGGSGGGIKNTGDLTIVDSTISDNHAGDGGNGAGGVSGTGTDAGAGQGGGNGGLPGVGGGVFSTGTLTVIGSLISGNTAGRGGDSGAGSAATAPGDDGGGTGGAEPGGEGGGVIAAGGLTINATTISGNASGVGGDGALGGAGLGGGATGTGNLSQPGGSGGGIEIDAHAGVFAISDSTIVANTASPGGVGGTAAGAAGRGGGIAAEGGGAVALAFSTVADNVAGTGGGIDTRSVDDVQESDSIVAANTGAPANCSGVQIADGGANVVFGDNSCPGISGDPHLGPLQANGGATPTVALGAGSAALNLVPAAACASDVDQRGVGRPPASCDAGAYQLAPPTVSGLVATATSSSTATVAASVDANFRDATVSVAFGPTTAYGSTVAAQAVTGNTPTAVGASLSGLTAATIYHVTVTATNADGTTMAADTVFATPPSAAIAAAPKPVLSKLTLTPPSFRPATKTHHKKRGTTITYLDSLAARTTFTVQRRTRGVVKGKRCLAPPKRRVSGKAKACTRYVPVAGSFSHVDVAAKNKLYWTGEMKGKPLAPGTYHLIAHAVISARSSASVTLTFTVRPAAS